MQMDCHVVWLCLAWPVTNRLVTTLIPTRLALPWTEGRPVVERSENGSWTPGVAPNISARYYYARLLLDITASHSAKRRR